MDTGEEFVCRGAAEGRECTLGEVILSAANRVTGMPASGQLLPARPEIERTGNLNLSVSFNPQRLNGPAR